MVRKETLPFRSVPTIRHCFAAPPGMALEGMALEGMAAPPCMPPTRTDALPPSSYSTVQLTTKCPSGRFWRCFNLCCVLRKRISRTMWAGASSFWEAFVPPASVCAVGTWVLNSFSEVFPALQRASWEWIMVIHCKLHHAQWWVQWRQLPKALHVDGIPTTLTHRTGTDVISTGHLHIV